MVCFRIYNTLTRSVDTLDPVEPGLVRIYCCGPTVYDYPHIGNWRTFTFTDLLRRSLLANGYRVLEVMNLTDIDDKIIAGMVREGKSLEEFTAPFVEAFFADLDRLRIQRAEHYPRATGHIGEIVELIGRLEEAGHVYRSGGSVYYRIRSFDGYGRLSRLDAGGIRDGARVDVDSYDKESARDFALWKGGKEEPVGWDSPWGRGRPGWHIECSAMSMKYLGGTFDLHLGGVDLIFPHHENEIAQSEGATGEPFVRCWVHAEHLLVEGEKMSKSLGNYYTLGHLLDKGFKPSAIRYLLLSTHYRSKLNFTIEALHGAASAVGRLRDFERRLEDYSPRAGTAPAPAVRCAEAFTTALADDLAIGGALAALFDFVREVNRQIDEGTLSGEGRRRALDDLHECDRVLDVLRPDAEAGDEGLAAWVEKLVAERNQARTRRDFARADAIRLELADKGILLEDGPQGTRWKRAE